MSRKGSEVIQFRVTPALRGALQAFAERHGLDSDSAAARLLLTTALGMEEGATAKEAARQAAIDEAIWTANRVAQEVVRTDLQEFAAQLGQKIARRLRAA